MYEILRKLSGEPTNSKNPLNQIIGVHMYVAIATVFVKFVLPWQPFQGVLPFLLVEISNFDTIICRPQRS